MIPVAVQPEPTDFSAKVRLPGMTFLAKVAKPTSQEYRRSNARYWSHARGDLYNAYGGICAYCAQWVPLLTATVDHYVPKSESSDLAYEWTNYRLSRDKLNHYKDNSVDVMDPFRIQYDWFTIDFTNFLIRPRLDLPAYLDMHVHATIEVLKLNKDNDLVQERVRILIDYSNDVYPLDFLERRYPFIAHELKRQGLEVDIKARLRVTPKMI